MEVIFEFTHSTPCQASLQGSPPFVVQLGSAGDPSAMYKPFIANTGKHKKAHHRRSGRDKNVCLIFSESKLHGRRRQGKPNMNNLVVPCMI
jgi:hypothetical protein